VAPADAGPVMGVRFGTCQLRAGAENGAMRLAPLGDTALMIEFGAGMDAAMLDQARVLADSLAMEPLPGVVDVVPAFGTVTVFYDLLKLRDYNELRTALEQRVSRLSGNVRSEGREVVIPVCYAAEYAPDLRRVAMHTGLEPAEVAALHCRAEYRVAAVGFTPGFPYLAGLPEGLHTPRLAKPRTAVPAGSVGLGGAQTGIYPLASPGGWNLIGRTPMTLFNAAAVRAALLRVGDRVRFRSISQEEFATWK
jgi:inhibitor of KinA